LEIGKGIVIYEGSDISILATGTMLFAAKLASEELMKTGLDVRLISMHTIKPLDTELVRACAIDSRAIFTVEEHSVNGGLGTAVSEVLLEFGYQGRFTKIGLPDQYSGHVGKGEYLRQQNNLTCESIVARILMEYEKCPRAAIRGGAR
jgi:transketolase